MKRRAALAVALGVAAVLGAASLAWACTSFSRIDLSSSAGKPGTEVTVTGQEAAAGAPVVIRWNSRTGPTLAETTVRPDGTFAVPVRIPESRPGVHVVLATDGKGDIARQAFEVTTGAPGQRLTSSPAFRSDGASATGRDWVRMGMNVLALGLLAAVPLVGLAVLARRPALAAARRER